MATGLLIETQKQPDANCWIEALPAAATEPVDHPSYEQPETGRELFASELCGNRAAQADGLGWITPELAETVSNSLTGEPLPRQEEARLFRQMNFCRHQLLRLKAALSHEGRRSERTQQRMILLHQIATKVRERIVEGNLGLVISTARRLDIGIVPFGDLVSEGNLALLRAADKFDVSRGFKFSTYACRAIQNAIQRLAKRTQRYRSRFPLSYGPDLDTDDGERPDQEDTAATAARTVREALGSQEAGLTDRERRVLKERFGIGPAAEPGTLGEVGAQIGVSEERARQIQNGALEKLRDAMEECLV